MYLKKMIRKNWIAMIWAIINIAVATFLLVASKPEQILEAVLITTLFFSTNLLFQFILIRQYGQKKAMLVSPLSFLAFNMAVGFIAYLLAAALVPGDGFKYIGIGGYMFINYSIFALMFLLHQKHTLSFDRKHLKYLVILLIGFGVSTFVYYRDIPSYTSLNMDAFQHMTAMKEMYRNGEFSFFLTEVNDSFTVKTYLPTFHMIFGPVISSVQLAGSIITYNIMERSFFLFATVVLYFFLYELTYNKPVALLGALLNIFLFEPTGAYTSFFLLPQTLTGFVGILILIQGMLNGWMNKTYFFLIAILIISMHFFIGPIILGLAIFLWALGRYGTVPLWLNKLIIIFLILMIFGSILTGLKAENISMILFNDLSSRQDDIITLVPIQVANEFFKILGPLILLYAWLIIRALMQKKISVVMVAIMILGISILLFIQFPYATKLFLVLHYLLVLFFVISLDFEYKVRYFIVAAVSVCFIIAFSFHLDLSTRTYKDIFYESDRIELITEDEYAAAKAINRSIEVGLGGGVVVSDPLTMSLVEPIVRADTTGGVWTKERKRVAIWKFLDDGDKDDLFKTLRVKDQDIYLVLNGRTVAWAEYDEEFVKGYSNAVWEPLRIDVREKCNEISKSNNGRIIGGFEEDSYCVIKLKKEQIVLGGN